MKIKKIFTALIITLISHLAFAQGRPVVSDISVVPREGGIFVKWNIDEQTNPSYTGFIVLRDTKQFTSYDQITSSNTIAELASNVRDYYDILSDFREYYYLIIASTESGTYRMILPSMNTNVSGIRAKKKLQSQEEVITPKENSKTSENSFIDPSEKMRNIPLPKAELTDEKNLKSAVFGKKAMNAPHEFAENYINRKNKITKMHVFEEDMICPEGGDEYFLFKILKATFAKKDFKNAIVSLNEFLSVHRSEEVQKRALFYLGESYYFTKDYRNALYNFLTVKEDFNELSKKWIDSSLDLIEFTDHLN